MRLSDAIRLGSMLRPQARGGFASVQVRGWRGWFLGERTMGSCALMAAAEAVGRERWTDVLDIWPEWMRLKAVCPVTGAWNSVFSVVWRLNDTHRWTREQIADWIETIEVASGLRADGDGTDVADARAPSPDHPEGGDREKEFVSS